VAAASREAMTLDLLGLESPSGPESQAASSLVGVGRFAKITLRLAPPVAEKMAAQARAAGLSQGVYLSTLVAGAPAVLTGADHRRAVAALTASNDEVARVATDLHGLVRLLRGGEMPLAAEVEATLQALSSEVRVHLRYASRLIADLAPLATVRPAGPPEKASSEGALR
jgi:hypothetical protein